MVTAVEIACGGRRSRRWGVLPLPPLLIMCNLNLFVFDMVEKSFGSLYAAIFEQLHHLLILLREQRSWRRFAVA